jgi:hypothetical protein
VSTRSYKLVGKKKRLLLSLLLKHGAPVNGADATGCAPLDALLVSANRGLTFETFTLLRNAKVDVGDEARFLDRLKHS